MSANPPEVTTQIQKLEEQKKELEAQQSSLQQEARSKIPGHIKNDWRYRGKVAKQVNEYVMSRGGLKTAEQIRNIDREIQSIQGINKAKTQREKIDIATSLKSNYAKQYLKSVVPEKKHKLIDKLYAGHPDKYASGSDINVWRNSLKYQLQGGSAESFEKLRAADEKNRQQHLARTGGKNVDRVASQSFGSGFTSSTKEQGYTTTGQAETERKQKVEQQKREKQIAETIANPVKADNKGTGTTDDPFKAQQPDKSKVSPYLSNTVQTSTEPRYTVETPDGKQRTFKDKQTADKFIQRTKGNYVTGSYVGFSPSGESYQGPAKPTYQITDDKGITRTFLSKESATKFSERTSKPVETPIGSLQYLYGQKPTTDLASGTEKFLKDLDKIIESKPKNPILRALKEDSINPLLGLTKATVAGYGTFYNLGTQLSAWQKGREPKVKQIDIPETLVGGTTENIIEGKSPQEVLEGAVAYTKKYGYGTVRGEIVEVVFGAAGIKNPIKRIPIFLPSGKAAGKTVTVFAKPILSKTSQGWKLGSVKPTAQAIKEVEPGFELIKGGKEQAKFNIRLIDEAEKSGKISSVYAQLSRDLIRVQELSRTTPAKVFAKKPPKIDPITKKQSDVTAKTIAEQQKTTTETITGKAPKLGQVGGSFSEAQQIDPKIFKPIIPGDVDVVTKGTKEAQYFTQRTLAGTRTEALPGQKFVPTGPRYTKGGFTYGKTKTDFPIYARKNVYWHGTDFESAIKIAKKGFSLRKAGTQSKEYLQRVTGSLKFASRRGSEISPPKTIFMTPNPKKALYFAGEASQNVSGKMGLVRVELKDTAKILRLKTFDPTKAELASQIKAAKKQGYEGVLKPMGGPKSNLELILFSKKPIKSQTLVEQTELATKQSKVKKFFEFLDDKDLTEGDLQAIKSGRETGAEYLGKKLSGKGIKGAGGMRIERLNEQLTKRITSFLTLQDEPQRVKQIKGWRGTGKPPNPETFGKELIFSPPYKRADKDIVRLVMDIKQVSQNLQKVKTINPIYNIINPKKGREMEQILGRVKTNIQKARPDLDLEQSVKSGKAVIYESRPRDYSSVANVLSKGSSTGKVVQSSQNVGVMDVDKDTIEVIEGKTWFDELKDVWNRKTQPVGTELKFGTYDDAEKGVRMFVEHGNTKDMFIAPQQKKDWKRVEEKIEDFIGHETVHQTIQKRVGVKYDEIDNIFYDPHLARKTGSLIAPSAREFKPFFDVDYKVKILKPVKSTKFEDPKSPSKSSKISSIKPSSSKGISKTSSVSSASLSKTSSMSIRDLPKSSSRVSQSIQSSVSRISKTLSSVSTKPITYQTSKSVISPTKPTSARPKISPSSRPVISPKSPVSFSPKSPSIKSPGIKFPNRPPTPPGRPILRTTTSNVGVLTDRPKKAAGPIIRWKTDKSYGVPRPKSRRYDFIGNVKVDDISGIYGKRRETVYGRAKTAGLAQRDIKITLSKYKKQQKVKLM